MYRAALKSHIYFYNKLMYINLLNFQIITIQSFGCRQPEKQKIVIVIAYQFLKFSTINVSHKNDIYSHCFCIYINNGIAKFIDFFEKI